MAAGPGAGSASGAGRRGCASPRTSASPCQPCRRRTASFFIVRLTGMQLRDEPSSDTAAADGCFWRSAIARDKSTAEAGHTVNMTCSFMLEAGKISLSQKVESETQAWNNSGGFCG